MALSFNWLKMSESFKWNPGQQRALDEVLYSGARFNLLYGGSRSGKTVLFCATVMDRALFAPKSKHLIVRKEASSARAALARGNMATVPMVARMRYPGMEITWNEKYGYFELPNESEIWIGGLNDEKAMERILGNEYATIYKNECSEINYSAHTLLRSRLAQQVKNLDGEYLSQRDYNDLNPTTRNHWTYRLFRDLIDPDGEAPVDPKQYKWGVINPMDNMENLSADYIADLESMSDRAKKRFFLGEYVEDVENALWSRKMIKRVQETPDLSRIVVAIDPAVSNNIGSDETGIIAAGIDGGGVGHTLADDSGKYSPEQWAKKAIALYDYYDADCIVAEVNQGGDMVESVIRAHRPDISYKSVRATRGKYTRAEPVAALYERNKVFHCGELAELEDQMCFIAGTMIETSEGQKPIELVCAGDEVMTRAGLRKVKVASKTGTVYSVVDIQSEDGRVITCTGNHPIFVRDKFVGARSVRRGDILHGSQSWGSTDAALKLDRLPKSWQKGAPIVGTNLKHAAQGECIVVKSAATRHIPPASVYNLSVEGLPEYFANGILVHNCAFTSDFDRKSQGYSPDRVDALVWAYTELFPSMTRRKGSSAPIIRNLGTMA